jgi:hypothetical protein
MFGILDLCNNEVMSDLSDNEVILACPITKLYQGIVLS